MIVLRLLMLVLATTAAAPPPTVQPPPSPIVVFERFDTNHSTLGFSVPILDGWSEVEGKFTRFTARVEYDREDVLRSRVEADLETASIDTGIDDRDADLRGAGFFDAEKYPHITFRSSRIERRGDGLVAVGTLAMHGVERPTEIPFRVAGFKVDDQGRAELAIAGDLVIDRDDWGITWRHQVAGFVGNRIAIRIRLLSRLTPVNVK